MSLAMENDTLMPSVDCKLWQCYDSYGTTQHILQTPNIKKIQKI